MTQNYLKKKNSGHYEEGEAPVEFASTTDEHYCQNFYAAEILLGNSSDNGKSAFQSVA